MPQAEGKVERHRSQCRADFTQNRITLLLEFDPRAASNADHATGHHAVYALHRADPAFVDHHHQKIGHRTNQDDRANPDQPAGHDRELARHALWRVGAPNGQPVADPRPEHIGHGRLLWEIVFHCDRISPFCGLGPGCRACSFAATFDDMRFAGWDDGFKVFVLPPCARLPHWQSRGESNSCY